MVKRDGWLRFGSRNLLSLLNLHEPSFEALVKTQISSPHLCYPCVQVAAVVALYCWATILSAYKYLASSLDQSGYIYSPVTPTKDVPQYYPR